MAPDSLDVLLVRLDDYLLALPAEQIGRIIMSKECTEDASFSCSSDNGASNVSSGVDKIRKGPVTVEIRTRTGTRSIRVDGLEGMITLGLPQIRKLPPLIQAQKHCPYIWGIALVDDQVVNLVDLYELSPGAAGPFFSRLVEEPSTKKVMENHPDS